MSAGYAPGRATCGTCAYFDNAGATLEEAIPGLRSLGSGFAAVRDRDGLCSRRNRYLPASAHCADYAAKGAEASRR